MLGGALFTRDYLESGITETPAWQETPLASLEGLHAQLVAVFESFPHDKSPNETHTEDDLIWKVLAALGWMDFLRQQPLATKGKEHVPDGILFPDADAKARANGRDFSYQRYGDGVAIVESKRWDRPLDRRERSKGEAEVPSSQMLRYLRRVDDLTEGKLRWGILTNGRHWRLYFQGAKSVSEEFLELDLSAMEINEIRRLSDVPLPEGVEIVALAHGRDEAVVSIHHPRAEEAEAPAAAAAAAAAAPVAGAAAPAAAGDAKKAAAPAAAKKEGGKK